MSRYLHRYEDYECVTDVHVILSIIYSAYIAHFSYTFYIHTRYSRDKIEIYHVLFALFTLEIDWMNSHIGNCQRNDGYIYVCID